MAVGNRTVSEVTRLGEQWQDKFNNLNQPYFLKFEEEGEEEFELSLRATSDAPTPGTVIEVEEYQDRGEFPRKIKKVYNQSGGGSGGGGQRSGGGGNSNPATDRKIIRQHAQKVAVTVWNPDDNWDKFVALCDKLCEDVFKYGGAPPAPATNAAPAPTLKEVQDQFKAGLTAQNIPVSDGVAAIGAIYGRDKLQVGDDIPQLLAKAKELADEDVPF